MNSVANKHVVKNSFAYHKNGEPRQVSSILYSCLWYLAMIGATYTYYESIEPSIKAAQPGTNEYTMARALAYIFGPVTCLLIGAIYHDIKKFDKSPEKASDDYPNYINTKTEWILRLLTMTMLLFAVGKVLPNFINNQIGYNKIYMYGNAVVFCLLTIWNLIAAEYRKKYFQKKKGKDYYLVLTRIYLYAIVYLLSFLYWIFLSIYGDVSSLWWYNYLILIFVLLTFVCVYMTYMKEINKFKAKYMAKFRNKDW